LQTADGDIDFEGLEQEDFQTMLSEGSWREWNHARKYQRLAWAG
jgi:hypothetical protein